MLGFFRRIVGKELSPEEQAQKRSEAIAAGAGNGALTVCVHFLVWDGDSEDSAHANVERLLKSAAAAGLVTSTGNDGGVIVVDNMDGGLNQRVPSIVRLGQSDANAPTFAPDGSCYNLVGGMSVPHTVSAPQAQQGQDSQFLSAASVAAFADVYARVNCLPNAPIVEGTGAATRGSGGAWRVPNERTHPWLASYSSAGTAPPVQFISAVSAEGIAIECASRLSDEFMAHAPILLVPEIGSTEEEFVLRRIAAYRREFGAENGENDERVYSDAEGDSGSPPRPKRFLGEGGMEEEIVDAEEEGPHIDAQRRAAAAARRGKGLESIDRVSFREQLLASEYMQCACDMDPVRRTIFRAAANEWDDELVTTAEFSVAFQKSISVQHAAACDMKAQEGNLAERALAKKRAARQGGDLDSNVAPGRFDDALSARTVGPNATLSADAKKKALLNAKQFGEIASQISRGVSVLSHMVVVVPAAQFRRVYEQVLDPRFSEEAHYVLAEAEQRAHFCPGSVTQVHLPPSVSHTVQAQLAHEARRYAAATGASGGDVPVGDGPLSSRPGLSMSAWGADSSSHTAGGVLPPPSARTSNAVNFFSETPSVEVAFDPQGAASAARAFTGESAVGTAVAADMSSTTMGSTTLTSTGVASHTVGSAYSTSHAASGAPSTFGVGNGGYGQGENFERTRAAVGVAGGWTLTARWSGAAAAPLIADVATATSTGGGTGAAIFSAMLPHLNVAARVGVALHPHPATFYEAIRPTWIRQLTAAAQARAGGAVGTAVDMNGGAAAAAAAASPLSSLGSLSPSGDNVPLVGARNPFASPQLSAHALVAADGEMMPPLGASTARNPVQALSQYVDQAIAPPAFAPGTDRKQQALQLEAHRERLRAHLDRLLDALATAGEAPYFLSCTRRDEICRLRTPATIETLLLILYNLDQKPTEQRFRILACGSERFYETLGKFPAAMAVLGGVGFSRFGATARVLMLSEAEAAAWAVERRRCIAVLEALYEARRIQHYLNPPPPQRNVDDLMY